jgi:hypothetical protein
MDRFLIPPAALLTVAVYGLVNDLENIFVGQNRLPLAS